MLLHSLHFAIFSICLGLLNGIDISKCPKLTAPENGHIICDHLLGAFCAPVCEPGYDYASTPARAYVCNPMTKSWATYPAGYPLPWPNCINSTTQSPTLRSSVPIKKSQVDQMTNRPGQPGAGTKNESLWQRMLKLTSELSQKKLKGFSKGAARSDLSNYNNINNKNNIDESNSNLYPTSSASLYQTENEIPQSQSSSQETEFQRLQQYWNEYYRNYYRSLNVKVGAGQSAPDWTLRSPWSSDPEHVEGALDRDFSGKDGQANGSTAYQNWNSYLQSFYNYPTPSNYQLQNTTDSYSATRPNSSSDHFIDNVISNDLQSKKVSDASINRDLYYEDQLLHYEEEKRPYLNVSNYTPTLESRLQSSKPQTTRNQLTAANQSYPSSYYKTASPVQPLINATAPQYGNAAIPTNSTSSQSSEPLSSSQVINSTVVANSYTSQTTARSNPPKDASNALNTSTPDRGYSSTTQNTSLKTASIPSNSSLDSEPRYGANKFNMTDSETDESETDASPISSALKADKKPPSSNENNISMSKSDYGAPVQSYVSQNPTGDPEDETDYIDDLDISALVRELIKLETIRKQKQLRRRKKIAKENVKTVGNMLVGDVFKGYFKNKKVRHQKALKKQLLNKAKLLIKSKAKAPPLPKFS